MKKILILDTSILCVWLNVSKMETCGPIDDLWDKKRVDEKINKEIDEKTIFVLPLASIIETGNHIAQADKNRKKSAEALADLILKSANEQSPWAAFSAQTDLWSQKKLSKLAKDWPNLAVQKISLGDATITDVAALYSEMGCSVEILTGDRGLKALQPAPFTAVPRRRQR